MTGHCLAVHEPRRGSLHDLEAEVGPGHELKDHVEHPLAGVGLQQLHDVGVFEHVADGRLPLQVVQWQARGGGELGHVHDLDSKLLWEQIIYIIEMINSPDPPTWFVCRWTHLRTTLKGPLPMISWTS